MSQIIDGKELAKNIREKLKDEVIELKNADINPKLAVIMVGDDKASKVYVKNKSKACEDVGIEYEEYILPANTKMEELLELIEKLNNDETVHGILVQSPLPKGLGPTCITHNICNEGKESCGLIDNILNKK